VNERIDRDRSEKARILVIYGYHPDEVFAQDVMNEILQNYEFPRTRFVRYTGKPDRKSHEYDFFKRTLQGFVRRYRPFEFLLDIHDSPRAVDHIVDKGKLIPHIPACGFVYWSRGGGSELLKKTLEEYSVDWDKEFPGRYVERHFSHQLNMSSRYGMFSVEFFPNYVSHEQSVRYLKGLIEKLTVMPRNAF
jgi:hypothetical protein